MTTPRIVILDGATLNPGDNPWTEIEALGEVEVFANSTPEQTAERLAGAEVAITNKVVLDRELLQSLPDLKFIAVTATGYDCVDIDAARELGLPVSNVPTYGTDSVSQFAFALLLELCHRVSMHDDEVRKGRWQSCGSFSFWLTPQIELAGLTMGIIGFGRIGRRTGQLADAFGMRVLAADTWQHDPPDYAGFEWATNEQVAAESDVISLHCNLTDETRGVVNADFLSKMKPSAFLINASRGPLLPGQAEVYLGGEFILSTPLPTVAPGERFGARENEIFGRKSRISIKVIAAQLRGRRHSVHKIMDRTATKNNKKIEF